MTNAELLKAWLTFASSLPWPVVTLLVAFRFRSEIRTLVSRLQSGEFAGAKFSLAEAADTISKKAEALATESDPTQRGRLAHEIQQVASSLGAVSNEWFRYDVRFRGLPEQFGAAFIPLIAAGTPTWREHRVKPVAPGEFIGTFFIKTGLSHNTFQRLAEQSGLIFLDVVGAVSGGTGRIPYDVRSSEAGS
jgi:hypothetical protein